MAVKYPIFNFYFISLVIINFAVSFSFYITFVTTTSYSLNILHSNSAQAGLACGIFIIGSLFSRFIFGSLSDNISIKPALIAALTVYFLSTLLYIFISSYFMLAALRFIHGFIYGAASTFAGTILARMIPASIRGTAIGYYALSIVAASAAAPFLAIYFIHIGFMNMSFIVSAFFTACAAVLSFFLKVKKSHTAAAKKGIFNISNYIEYSALPVSIISLFMTLAFSTILSFIGDYSISINLVKAGSWFFVIYAAISLFARPASGRIYDTLGHNFVLMPAILLFAVSLYLLSIADNSFILLLSALFAGVGYGSFFSAGQSYALSQAPKERLGLATSTYYIFLDLGGGIGPYIFGFAGQNLGYKAMYQICAALICSVFVLYLLLIFKRKKV